jgi:hypothetical protein
VIIFLFILQLPVQAIKFFYYGYSEDTIGTYATHGGGHTTVIPLVALGYLIAFYYLYEKKIIYLILSTWFIAYGIIGLKLALLYLYPIAFLSLYYFNVIRFKGIQIPRDIFKIIFIALITIIIGTTIISKQVRTNKERTIGGSVDLSYALKSSMSYTTRSKSENPELALGRIATTKLTLSYLWDEGFTKLIFGFGPGIINKIVYESKIKEYKTKIEKIAGSYGKSGAIYTIAQYGLVGLTLMIVIYSVFIKNCWKLYISEKDIYWRAFASGSLFFALVNMFIYMCYNTVTLVGDTIVPVFFYCMALVYKRNKKIHSFNQSANR